MEKTIKLRHYPPPAILTAFLTAAVFLSASCSRTEHAPMQYSAPDSRLLTDIRSNLPETIRVFDPDEFFPPTTKADCGLPVDIPSDALDYGNASTLSNSLYDYVQIPIHASTPLNYASVRFPLIPDGKTPSETAASKAFLIVQSPKDSSWTAAYTVTIIPHPDYMTPGQLDSLDFFYDGFFNAVYIYADLEGKVFKAETYIHGTLWKTGTVNTAVSVPEDSSAVTAGGDTVISALTPKRSMSDDPIDDYVYIPELVFTADRIHKNNAWVFNSEDTNHPSNQWHNERDASLENLTTPLVGGGGGGDKQSDRQLTCKVIIAKEGRGEVSGEGEYTAYETVTCTASPHMAGDIQTSEFIHWTGDISSSSQTLTFSAGDYLLREHVSLTAVFHDINPCADEENDRRDPLREMKIQASGAGGWNIKGGTFGDSVRRGDDLSYKGHYGMDFACPEGTPVYATHDGIVSAIRDDVLPSDESFGAYRKRGGKDCEEDWIFKAGNAVEIECYINGSLYTIKYYHLTSVEGTLYKEKPVKAGDIIGLSGITGNGGSKSSGGPHLHYQVNIGKSMYDKTNPEPFIYSKFDNKGIQTNPCDE